MNLFSFSIILQNRFLHLCNSFDKYWCNFVDLRRKRAGGRKRRGRRRERRRRGEVRRT